MQVYESPDCSSSDDLRLTTYCRVDYHDANDPTKKGTGTMFTCQPSNHDTPSADNLNAMKQMGANDLHIPIENVVVNPTCRAVGAWTAEVPTNELLRRNMTSSCSPTFNLQDVTSYVEFQCRYLGSAPDANGNVGTNPFRTWTGRIATCDLADEFDQTEEDIRKIAHHMMGGKEAGIDLRYVQCDTLSSPIF